MLDYIFVRENSILTFGVKLRTDTNTNTNTDSSTNITSQTYNAYMGTGIIDNKYNIDRAIKPSYNDSYHVIVSPFMRKPEE